MRDGTHLGQRIWLPAAGCLALEGVLPRQPEPAVTPVLDHAVKPVHALAGGRKVAVLDPKDIICIYP